MNYTVPKLWDAMSDQDRIDRRQFAKCVSAVSGSVAVLLSAPLWSAVAAEHENGKVKPEDAVPAKPEQAVPKPLAQEVLLLRLLLERYPSEKINEAAVRGIVSDLRGDMGRGRMLSEFVFKNSDEPCSVFRAYRRPE